MRKKYLLLIAVLSTALTTFAQVPRGMSYQAIARDNSGDPITGKSLNIKLSFYQSGDVIWTEEHEAVTNAFGLFTLVIGADEITGSGTAGSFDGIDWSTGGISMQTEVDDGTGYVDIGTTEFQSVPYALYAENGGGGDADPDPSNELQDLHFEGNNLTLSNDPTPDPINLDAIVTSSSGWTTHQDSVSTFRYVGIGTTNTNESSLTVQGLNSGTEAPLFEVKREDGVPVFAVYNDGVMVYVDEDAQHKGVKGGFAVGGYSSGKNAVTQEFLRVTPDSVRIYVPETASAKGLKGGFAVGGYSQDKKSTPPDYLYVTPDSVRVYVPNKENDPGYVGLQGGFAVNSYDKDLGADSPYEYLMGINRGITRFNTTDANQGFAIGSQQEGWGSNYLELTPQNSFIGFESGLNTRTDPDAWDANQGARNVFMGYKAGRENRYGHHNVFIGYQAGLNLVGDSLDEFSGSYNIIMGPNSGRNLEYGWSNIFIGNNAGTDVPFSTGNIFIGESAGSSAGDSENNIFIGNFAGYANDGSNQLYIENSSSSTPLIYGEFDNDLIALNGQVAVNTAVDANYILKALDERAYDDRPAIFAQDIAYPNYGKGIEGQGGFVGIQGTATAVGSGTRYAVYGIAGNGSSANYGVYGYAYGANPYAVYAAGNLAYTGSLLNLSDQSVKKNIADLEKTLPALMQLRPRTYQYKNNQATKAAAVSNTRHFGLLAQEVEQVFPQLVSDIPVQANPGSPEQSKDDTELYKGVNYMELIPLLLKGMQEQQEEIEMLKAKIAAMEATGK